MVQGAALLHASRSDFVSLFELDGSADLALKASAHAAAGFRATRAVLTRESPAAIARFAHSSL